MSSDTPAKHSSASESRDVAEAAREKEWDQESFARHLFDGCFRLDLLDPLPQPDPAEEARSREFLERLDAFAREHIDGERFDREGWVPDEVLDGLRELGAFGIKISRDYGGLGFSQLTYNRALEIVGSRCGSTGAFLSAHQSIGVPQPLALFGSEEQKRKYLPRLAKGALSAFALTEAEVGSDPANMSTTAELTEDGDAYILNGEKLWTTNGPRSELMVVMARTPPRENVRAKRPITAFIVETDWPGVEVKHICHFMGLRALSNGVITFDNVRVPKENLLWGEGQGLKLALITLNTGRLSLPAFCTATGKVYLELSRKWAAERVQWGAPIGKHDAIAQMLGRMTANTFAMDAGLELSSLMADSKRYDIRLEAAMAKLWHSETAWALANDALQIRGGRGYETEQSLKARGEPPIPVERGLRDLRINLIFEGSSEIMRLFIAREAVDSHLKVAGDLVDPRAPAAKRVRAAIRAAIHYAWWYPSRWVGWGGWPRYREYGPLARHLRFVNRTSRRLARSLFHAMVRFGPRLEQKQAVLGRLVDIGAELFMMTAACLRARVLVERTPSDRSPEAAADLFCRHARRRIRASFRNLFANDDDATYRLAQRTLEGQYAWVEKGVIGLDALEAADAPPEPATAQPRSAEALEAKASSN